jgi:DNA-binding NarL/FixJ family response regulator
MAHINVVGEAGNGKQALELTQKLQPHVVLMDISMPEVDGIEATKRLREKCPDARVLILTMHDNKEYIVATARAGARGFLLKDSAPDQLVLAIERVYAGDTFFDNRAAKVIVDTFIREAGDSSSRPVAIVSSTTPPPSLLTRREREVLGLVTYGLTSRDIADRLGISTRTVEAHRARIGDKLDIRSVAELTRYALEHGITSRR